MDCYTASADSRAGMARAVSRPQRLGGRKSYGLPEKRLTPSERFDLAYLMPSAMTMVRAQGAVARN